MKSLNKFIALFSLICLFGLNSAHSQCTASFSYIEIFGLVDFTSTSVGGTNYYWDFGDGNTYVYIDSPFTNYVNPVNAYTTNGTYTVCLAIEDSASGCNDTICQVITVINASPCNIVAGYSYVDNGGGNISFTSSFTGGTAPFTYYWWFSSGNTSTAVNPNFTYPSSGTYYPQLTITDTSGCTDVYTDTIVVSVNPPCNLTGGFTDQDYGGGSFLFTSFVTTGAAPYTYLWDFNGFNSSASSAWFTYPSGGIQYPSLTITDSNGCVITIIDTLTVNVCNYNVSGNLNTLNNAYYSSNYYNGTNYLWDFGDGFTSTQQYPQHTYAASGTYIYCLTIDSCAPVCDTLVIDICNFNISAAPDSVSNNTNFSTNAVGSNYFWTFGDGNTSTQQYPQHTYASAGTYYYCLTVDSCPTVCDSVVVLPPCSVFAGYTYIDNGNGTIVFTNTSTGASTPNYFWNFGDGNFTSATNPSNTYASNGTYTVCLDLYDTLSGCFNQYCSSVIVTSLPQCNVVANFTYNDNGNGNYTFTSTSTGNSYVYWGFGDGSFNNIDNIANHTYLTNGVYNVYLEISDSSGACMDTAYATITVTSVPQCNLVASFNYTDNGNGNFSFTNTSTGNIVAYYWNFGDGTSSNLISPNHTFVANGIFVVELAVIDSGGNCIDYELITLQVTGVSTIFACNSAFVIFPDSASPNNVIVFNTATGTNLTYFWDFGDGNTSNQAYPFYTYTTAGPFLLCLTVDDGNGCVDTYCDSIYSGGVVLKQSGFTINIQAPVLTSIDEQKMITDFKVYPNPVKDHLTIELNLLEQSSVKVFITDVLGNNVTQINTEGLNLGNNKLLWIPTNISNGIYLLNIKSNNSLQVKKLVLNR